MYHTNVVENNKRKQKQKRKLKEEKYANIHIQVYKQMNRKTESNNCDRQINR